MNSWMRIISTCTHTGESLDSSSTFWPELAPLPCLVSTSFDYIKIHLESSSDFWCINNVNCLTTVEDFKTSSAHRFKTCSSTDLKQYILCEKLVQNFLSISGFDDWPQISQLINTHTSDSETDSKGDTFS